MTAIHHATAKRAEKLGLLLTIGTTDDTVSILDADGNVVHIGTPGQSGKEVLAAYEATDAEYNEPDSDEPEDDDSDEDDDDIEASDDEASEDEPVERSIVKRKYRKRYQPTNRTCGDDMAQLISSHVKEDGEVNIDKLIRFAKANDCWIDSYRSLNNGQVRMNVGNRLRAKIRKGHEVIWAD